MLAPIILFVYLRPLHTQKTLDSLAKNQLALQSTLYVFIDGLKENATEKEKLLHQEIKNIFEKESNLQENSLKEKRFKKINIITKDKNIGLANSIITGVSEIIRLYGRVIVLEDDLVLSPFFLQYMNDALDMYANDDKVMHISAYSPKTLQSLPNYFFTTSISSWGWATWERAWQKFNPDANVLVKKLQESPSLKYAFNYENTYDHFSILEAYITRRLSTWAGRWYASVFLEKGLSLWLGMSLVQNIGFDGTGEHCGIDDKFDVTLHKNQIFLQKIPIQENLKARKILKNTYRFMRLFPRKTFFQKIKTIIIKVLRFFR